MSEKKKEKREKDPRDKFYDLLDGLLDTNDHMLDKMTQFINKLKYSEFLAIIDLIYPEEQKEEQSCTNIFRNKVKQVVNKYVNLSLATIVANFIPDSPVDIYMRIMNSFIRSIYEPAWIIIYTDDPKIVKEIIKRSRKDLDMQTIEEWVMDNAEDLANYNSSGHEKWSILYDLVNEEKQKEYEDGD